MSDQEKCVHIIQNFLISTCCILEINFEIKFQSLCILSWYAKYTPINVFYEHIINCIWIWSFLAGLDDLENARLKAKKYFEN